ncbi:acyltransferase family protein [Cupriavidus pauculus]|uniref:acyltransferase family protein n=1 Tax=Cupriavidus pauculus TaxID=82633 RepID=UPI0015DDDA28|nr:acyltransferase [Cupriavidus pauculus]
MKHAAPKRNDEIQAVRAIAILIVIVAHSPVLFRWGGQWSAIGKGFYVGVDLFLCLSGYVITKSLCGRLLVASGNDFWREVAAFWVRRLYRITPSACVWLAIPLLAYSLASGRVESANISDVLSAVFHVANIRSWQCQWIVRSGCGDFGHYWSLSLEEQFYLVLPFLFLLFRRRIHLVLLAIVLAQVFLPRPLGSVFGPIKTDALMLGVLLALWSEHSTYRIFDPHLASSRLKLVLPPLLVAGLVGFARYEPVPFFLGMVALVSGLIIWLCSYDKGYFIADGPIRRGLAWIGERSFAIYLIHPFAFWITWQVMRAVYPGVEFNGTFTVRFAMVAAVIVLVLSELSYRLIELPFRKRGVARSNAIAALRDGRAGPQVNL